MAGNKIGMLRREKGLNQKELGDKLGVGQTTVSAWETGKNEPDYKSIRAMCALFEVGADYLLGFDDDDEMRGLSPEEYKKVVEKARQAQLEHEVNRYIEAMGEYEDGLSPDDEEAFLHDDWRKSGMQVQFETFKVIEMMENASKAQREQIVKLVEVALGFPTT